MTQRYVTRTWSVTPMQAQAVKTLADALGINHSELARRLLDFSLAAVRTGALHLEVRPAKWELVPWSDDNG